MGILVAGVIIVVGSLAVMCVIHGSKIEKSLIERLNDYDY